MTGLLPEDPEEIRRIYRQLRREPLLPKLPKRVTPAPQVAAGWLLAEVGLLFFVLGKVFVTSLGGIAVFAASACVLASATACSAIAYSMATNGMLALRNGRAPIVTGILTLLVFRLGVRKAAMRDRQEIADLTPIHSDEIDVESLEVLEPVARAIAEPILQRARQQNIDIQGETNGHILWVATLRRRLVELQSERDEETDPIWNAAIVRRIEEIEREIEEDERAWNTLQASRARVTDEADAVEDLLRKLTRRRRLLQEIALSRTKGYETEAEPDHRSAGISDLRERLQNLGESLAARDAGTDRLKAELELREIDGR